MDDTNDETTPAVEEATCECPEKAPEEGKCPLRGHGRLLGGLVSGAVVGHVLALMLAPVRGERRSRWSLPERSRWQNREALEEEARLRAQVGLERAEAVVLSVPSRLAAAWATLRERLRDARDEWKDGVEEGQADARARYEFMTKRRRPRR
jgi:gas vesicle protein